jgi:PAS domain S-box-containing protein
MRKDRDGRLTEALSKDSSLVQAFEFLFNNAGDVIFILNTKRRVVAVNRAVEEMSKHDREFFVGQSFESVVPPEVVPQARRNFANVVKGESASFEARFKTSGNVTTQIEVTAMPCMSKGKVVAVLGIVRDVTERRKTEEALQSSEARFRASFENVPDGVYQSTPEGKIVTANPALVHMLGYSTVEELRVLNIARDLYVNPNDRRTWMRKLNEEGRVRNAELVLRRKDDQELIALENSNAIRDRRGKVLYYEGTLTDITERKTLEERLSALNFYGGKLNAAQNIQQVYELTLDALEQTMGFENAVFLRVEKNRLQAVCRRGHCQRMPELLLNKKKGITVKVANACKPVLAPDVRKNKHYVEGTPGVQSELAVPVIADNKVLGVLDVQSRELAAFDERDMMMLQILASHATTAIGNLEKREEIEKRSAQLALMMKYSAEMIHSVDVRQRLQKIAEAIQELGWRRVVIRAVRNERMDLESRDDLVTAGLTEKEIEFLWNNKMPGQVWCERFGSEFERFRIGEFFHLPWSDPWVRRRFSEGTVPSKLPQEEMVDWDPQDLLYAPLRLANGRIVGILSIDDPIDGRRPTRESLIPFELFIHQAAVAIENAQLFEQLEKAKNQVKEYAKRLEEKVKERTIDLRRSEEKLRSIITASPSAVTATDQNGVIIECNEQTLRMHEYQSKEELIGKSAFELIAKKDRQKAFEGLKRTVQQGLMRNIEYTFATKNGREFPAELSVSVVRDASGNPIGFVAITSDITERKRMEQQLVRSERLAAIGEVAAMVGHDLRNPLTGIAGAAYYLKMKLDSRGDGKKKEMLELIEKDIEHSNKIINDLLEYSREIHLELTETVPRSIIEEALSMIKTPGNVKVSNLTRNTPSIHVDKEKLKRVFLNIIQNAIDAMPEGGRLTIKSKRSGENVELAFSDTGIGMTEYMLGKIFTPLFTTKAKGMGFGLAICKRIVEAHGGKVSVKTAPAKGTTFAVIVPIKPEMDGGEKTWVNVPESLLSTTMKA